MVRPLTLDAREVRAVLAGTMTEVRRPILPPRAGSRGPWRPSGPVVVTAHDLTDPWFEWRAGWPGSIGGEAFDWRRCAIGSPGDRLWVRETWAPADRWADGYDRDDPTIVAYAADGKVFVCVVPTNKWLYDGWEHFAAWHADKGGGWRSSTQMPRWASRLTLEVTGVRVERVQGLTEEGARASGTWAANPWVWVVTFNKVEVQGG